MHSTSIEHPYSYTNGKHCIQTVPHNIQYEIDFETVCQYTGLTDKDGRKIFEGDIVSENLKGLKPMVFKIIWDKEEAGWMRVSESGAMYGVGAIKQSSLEVIGNIFDNPEMIRILD